jgi:hypothetical protein
LTIITPTEFARQCGITKQAVFKSLDAGLIPFIERGKKKLIDTDNPDVLTYARSTSYQREDAKKNDSGTSEKSEQIMTKSNNTSDKRDKKLSDPRDVSGKPPRNNEPATGNDEDTKFMIDLRTKRAKMKQAELTADALEKKLLPTDFVEFQVFRYLEKLNSNIERTASVYVTDMGKQILSDGEVLPKHIEKFTADCLALIDDTKKAIKKEIKKYEPKL